MKCWKAKTREETPKKLKTKMNKSQGYWCNVICSQHCLLLKSLRTMFYIATATNHWVVHDWKQVPHCVEMRLVVCTSECIYICMFAYVCVNLAQHKTHVSHGLPHERSAGTHRRWQYFSWSKLVFYLSHQPFHVISSGRPFHSKCYIHFNSKTHPHCIRVFVLCFFSVLVEALG